ncbi:MAG: patatin-like phospholipase family protein, partial [Actinomycetota bacterium]
RFEDAQIPLGVVATDLETGAEELFTSGEITSALLASTAMPSIYPPVKIGGRTYIDGGVSNNVPIAPAVEMGAKTVYVMNSTSHSHQRRPLSRPMDYLLHAFTLARSQRLVIDEAAYAQKVRLVMLPTAPLDFFVPFAAFEYTDRLIELSYEHTRRFLSGVTEATVETTGGVEAIAPAK